MRIFFYILFLAQFICCNLIADTDTFKLNHGDRFIIDDNVDFNNRGYQLHQDYINPIGKNDEFKILINTVNGNLFHQRVDYFEDESGFPIKVVFTYNSGSQMRGHYGNNWQLNYNIRYVTNNFNKHKVMVYPDNRTSLFLFDSLSKNFQPYFFTFDSLKLNENNKLNFRFYDNLLVKEPQKITAVFDLQKSNLPERIFDDYDNEIQIRYLNDTLIKSITYLTGNNIIFEYEGSYLYRIILPGGSEISYYYDINGNLASAILPNGKFYIYKYDDCNNLIQIIDDRREYFITYDENYKVSSFTNHYSDLYYSISYDTLNKKTTLFYPDSTEKIFYYDNLERSTSIKSINGIKFDKTWNSKNLISNRSYSSGNSWKYEYDDFGRIISVTNPENLTTFYEWDTELNNKLTIKQGQNVLSSYLFDKSGNIKKFINPFGEETEIMRSINGNISDIIFPNSNKLTFLRDERGRIIYIDLNNINQLILKYNFEDYIVSINDIFKNSHRFEYDQSGRLISIDYPDSSTYAIFYLDNIGKAIVLDRDNLTNEFSFDMIGRITALKDKINNESHFLFNNFSEYIFSNSGVNNIISYNIERGLTNILYNDSKLLSFNYDGKNNLTSISDNGLLHKFKYNNLSLLSEYTNPDGNSIYYNYDKSGNLINYTNEQGKVTNYSYDSYRRIINKSIGNINISFSYDKYLLKSLNYNDITTTFFDYDDLGYLIEVKEPDANTYYYKYDISGNLIEQTLNNFFVTSYQYSNNYFLKHIVFPNAYKVSLKYDVNKNIIKKSDNLNNLSEYIYDKKGRISKIINENGNFKEYVWNEFHNLVSIKGLNAELYRILYENSRISITYPNGAIFKYKYNLLGRNLQISDVENPNGSISRFFYNKCNFLTGTVDNNSGQISISYNSDNTINRIINPLNQTFRFTYDILGRVININNPETNNKTIAYDALSRITSLTDYSADIYNLDYKADGKLLSVRSYLFDIKYNYNNLNQLSEFKYNNQTSLNYNYDNLNISSIVYSNSDTILFDYYLNNLLKTKRNESGDIFHYFYTSDGYLNSVNSSTNFQLKFKRDKYNNIQSVNLNDSIIANFNYNNFNTFTSVNTLDTSLNFIYNIINEITQIIEPNNLVYQLTYDFSGRVNSKRFPDDKREFYSYNAKGNLIKYIARDGQVFDYEYNFFNNITKYKWARLDSIIIIYKNNGLISSIIQPNGTISDFEWLSSGKLKSFNLFKSGKNEILYNSQINNNSYFKIQLNTFDSLTYQFDNKLRFIGLSNENYGKIDYDNSGRNLNKFRLFEFLPDEFSENYEYLNGKLISINTGSKNYEFLYDDNSILSNNIKINGDEYLIKYNSKFKPEEVKYNNSLFSINYNLLGLVSSINDNNFDIDFTYNNSKLINKIIKDSKYSISIDYNNSNNIETISDNLSNLLTFQYDNKGNLRLFKKLDNAKIEYLYDTYSNLIIIKNETLDETGIKFNSQNLVYDLLYPNLSNYLFTYDSWFNNKTIKNTNNSIHLILSENNKFELDKRTEINYGNIFTKILSNNTDKILKYNNVTFREINKDSNSYLIKIANGKSITAFENEFEMTFNLPNGLSYIFDKSDLDNQKIYIRDLSGNLKKEFLISKNNYEFKIFEDNILSKHYEYNSIGKTERYKLLNQNPVDIEYFDDGRISKITSDQTTLLREFDNNNRLIKSGDYEVSYDERGNITNKFSTNDFYEYKYDFENKLTNIYNSKGDSVEILYIPGNIITGFIRNQDTTFIFPVIKDNICKFPFSNLIMDELGEIEYYQDLINISGFNLNYKYKTINNTSYYPLIIDDYTIIGLSDDSGNFISLSSNIGPLGDLYGINDSLKGVVSYYNMMYFSELNLYYDGERFYDSELGIYFQEKFLNFENPLNQYDIPQKQKLNQKSNKIFAIKEGVINPEFNPFKNRFINIKDEVLPENILINELNSQFNNFVNYGIIINRNSSIPQIDNKIPTPVNGVDLLMNNQHSNIQILPKLPSFLLDTILLESSQRILPENIKKRPEGNEFEQILGFLRLIDMPKNSIINVVMEKIQNIPNPFEEIIFNNIYDVSPIYPEIEVAEKILGYYNLSSHILNGNIKNNQKKLDYNLEMVADYLPKIKHYSDLDYFDILEINRNISQINSKFINPTNYFPEYINRTIFSMNNNFQNFFTDVFQTNPENIIPGRTLYQKKYLPLPYSNDNMFNLPLIYPQKKSLKFKK